MFIFHPSLEIITFFYFSAWYIVGSVYSLCFVEIVIKFLVDRDGFMRANGLLDLSLQCADSSCIFEFHGFKFTRYS